MDLPEFERPVTLTHPVTTNGGVTSDYISLKGVHEVFIVATATQAVADATTISIYQATAVAGTSAKALAKPVPVWAIADTSVTDLFTRQDDAVSYDLAATAKNQKVVFRVKAADLDGANGFDCLNVVVADSTEATDLICIDAIIVPRYGAVSVIVD